MREFTRARSESTLDELWLLEHAPVYTIGQGGKALVPEAIRVDRGGDVTYHGPGQVVLYTLVDLARRGLKVKTFVCLLEQAVIDLVRREGWKVEGMYNEVGQLDEVFRRITLPDTVKR